MPVQATKSKQGILYNLVLSDIQEVAAMALKDKKAFYGRLSQRTLADTDSLKKECESLAQLGDR